MPGNRSPRLGEGPRLGKWIAAGLLVLGLLVLGKQTLESHPEWVSIRVAEVPLRVEVANDPASRSRGLMYRAALPGDAGMLFVWPQPQPLAFWMKNTLIDLDVGFFDAEGRLINVATMQAGDDTTRHSSASAARYGLEVNAGWFAAHAIEPGARLRLPHPLSAR